METGKAPSLRNHPAGKKGGTGHSFPKRLHSVVQYGIASF
ncbi:hypothetical protein HMPREF3213_00990 [Heyndrickxia coagulans]|uniref:Uncharacterized protein n=1 Tax=Heyndrickxia coagulans TaxID=1398 RepID=A0A133KWQ9_HEYCO|nr:hypothetical protein HMPREF3213_00990 [Heyndrickxia coagulans]